MMGWVAFMVEGVLLYPESIAEPFPDGLKVSHICVPQQYADGDSFLLLVSSSFGSVNVCMCMKERLGRNKNRIVT